MSCRRSQFRLRLADSAGHRPLPCAANGRTWRNCRPRVGASVGLAAFVLSASLLMATDDPVFRALELPTDSHLQNVFRIGDDLLSGSAPHDEQAFAELASLGVTMIVSVDGTAPDIHAARDHGIRYVHIPIGYDQVDAQAIASLTRLARERQGTIYVHCHHGKHRGPAAAAALCRLTGAFDVASAEQFLRAAGTDERYEGLWQSVLQFEPLAADAELPPLVEISPVDPVSAAMSRLEQATEQLREDLSDESGADDVADPTAETFEQIAARRAALALLALEGLVESQRTLPSDSSAKLREAFALSILDARQLHRSFGAEPPPSPLTSLDRFRALESRCRECHAAHRE